MQEGTVKKESNERLAGHIGDEANMRRMRIATQ